MANYRYDESGSMATYFLISLLAIILIPMTLSSLVPKPKHAVKGCQCQPCIDQRNRIMRENKGSLLNPHFSGRTKFLIVGWTAMAYLCYQIAGDKTTNTVYNPFDILGISMSATEKEIKSRYKSLSKIFHPDKVKLKANETMEVAQNYFVELTKAYKSLTNEEVRENVRKYGHPDGRRDVSMGIALPLWVIEGKNNIWVLGLYGIVFGGALPALVGRWWFGTQRKTKDGVSAQSASIFFKNVKEDSSMDDVVSALSNAYRFERTVKKTAFSAKDELDELDKRITEKAGDSWRQIKRLNAGTDQTALLLLFAYLVRVPVNDRRLQREQNEILLQTPALLNALLNITTSRNWLLPTLSVMRLHAYITQALLPSKIGQQWAQLPDITLDETAELSKRDSIESVVQALEAKGDGRVENIKKAARTWGQIELVDAFFRVIGERIVVPSSIVYLVVKVRISPPTTSSTKITRIDEELDAEQTKKAIRHNDEKDDDFLISKKEAEDLADTQVSPSSAHAPYWPASRKPSWWIVLADDKSNRVVVPPMKISDVPFGNPNRREHERDFRSYKLQFQAPPNTGLFTWRIYLVSDTFVGEAATQDIMLKIDDVSALTADEKGAEDEISEPEEDSLAGQMAVLRGGKVKASGANAADDDESDEESDTDGDEKDSSSDSDSD